MLNCDGISDVYEYFNLVDLLISDILHLEDEVVMLRRDLAKLLPTPDNTNLMSGVFSDLSRNYGDAAVFAEYCRLFHNSVNPLDSPERVRRLECIAGGVVDSR